MNLGRLYKERTMDLQGISTCKELSDLLARDERSFYFYLMDSYYSNRDLSFIRKDRHRDVLIAISLFCVICQDSQDSDYLKVRDYIKQYVNIEESPTQIGKVLNEINIARAKEKFLRENNMELKNGELVKRG